MKKLSWLITIAALLVGSAGVYQQLKAADYSSAVPWGLGVATYMLASGLSAGAYLSSNLPAIFGIQELEPIRRPGLLLALAALIAALAAIGLDLGHPGRAWEVFFTPNSHSPMAWMVWLYSIFLIILIWQLYYEARGEGTPGGRQPSRSLAMVGVLVAAAFSGGLGALLGAVQARPYWSNLLLPVMFLVAALVSGSALLTFVVAVTNSGRQDQETSRAITILARVVLGLLVFYLIFELAEMLLGSYYLSPDHVLPYQQVLAGPNWWIFWGVHLVVGALVPVLLLMRSRLTAGSAGWAGLLIAIGFLGVRYNIVVPGLLVPPFPELPAAYSEPGLAYSYVPVWSEWLTVLFVLALGVFVFKLGMKYLPFNRHPQQQQGITGRLQDAGTGLSQ